MTHFRTGLVAAGALAACLYCGLTTAGPNAAQAVAQQQQTWREILASMDLNNDGKLSQVECLAASKHKSKLAVDCKYWDINSNGYITEKEYVTRALGIIR